MAPKVSSALAPRPRIDMQALLKQAVGQDDEQESSVDDILHGLDVLHEQREACRVADEMYDGDVGMVFASEAVRHILTRGGVEALDDFNYAHIPVDAIAKRLQISSVVAAPAEENADGQQVEEDAAAKAANKAIAALRKVNELDAEEKRLHLDVSKHGECYLFVWPGLDPDGNESVDIRVNSAHNVVMIYDEEDQLRARYVLKSWVKRIGDGGDAKDATRATLYYADRIERWTTKPGGNPRKREDWYRLDTGEDLDVEDEGEFAELAADEFYDPGDDGVPSEGGDGTPDEIEAAAGIVPNPYGRIPWFHFRNNRPHGIPEHKNAYGPQALINKVVYALAGGVDFQSLPQKWILVDPTQDDPLQNLVDPDHPDDEDDDPENTGGSSGLRAAPGEIWRLFGKSVGQFDPGDPSRLISLFDRCVKAMAELTGLPQWAFSRTAGDMPSGESVRELNGDLNATVKDRQDRYDATWQDSYEFALKILEIAGVTVDVRWAPIEMVNDVGGWQVVQAKIAAGVPPRVALEEAGYAREQVEDWLKDASGADVGRRVALLGMIANATQAFGASIVTGAVSPEQVQAIIGGLLGLTMEGTDVELPETPDDFVDPQAQLKAQQDMQRAQLDHATATQQASQEHSRTMAEEGHRRMQENLRAGGAIPPGPQPGNRKPATAPGAPQNSGGRTPAGRPALRRDRAPGTGNSGGR